MNINYPVSWQKWQKVNDSNNYCKIEKITVEGTGQELIEYICGKIPEFVEHSYTKRNQALYMKNLLK
jgi:hypothetical protein